MGLEKVGGTCSGKTWCSQPGQVIFWQREMTHDARRNVRQIEDRKTSIPKDFTDTLTCSSERPAKANTSRYINSSVVFSLDNVQKEYHF